MKTRHRCRCCSHLAQQMWGVWPSLCQLLRPLRHCRQCSVQSEKLAYLATTSRPGLSTARSLSQHRIQSARAKSAESQHTRKSQHCKSIRSLTGSVLYSEHFDLSQMEASFTFTNLLGFGRCVGCGAFAACARPFM